MKMRILKPGSTGEDVYNVQYMLKKLEYRISDLSNVYKDETKSVVESFQNDMGMNVTGIVDMQTFNSISRLFEKRFPDENAASDKKCINKDKKEPREVQDVKEDKDVWKGILPLRDISITKTEQDMKYKERDKINSEPKTNLVPKIEKIEDIEEDNIEEIFHQKPLDDNFVFEEDYMPMENSNEISSQETNQEYDPIYDIIRIIEELPDERQSPSETLEYPILREGSNNVYVRILQSMLKSAGFYSGAVDGIFGPNTKNAVINFQSSQGLTPDGIVGPKTWQALENYVSGSAKGIIPPDYFKFYSDILNYAVNPENYPLSPETREFLENIQSAYNLPVTGEPDYRTMDALNDFSEKNGIELPKMKVGDRNEIVKNLQQTLIDYGFMQGVADGIYGPKTAKGVQNFQTAIGVNPTGTADLSTLMELREYMSIQPPKTVVPGYRFGDKNTSIKNLQDFLIKSGFLQQGQSDGIMGPVTSDAIKRFQSVAGLTPTGVVDHETLSTFYEYMEKAAADEQNNNTADSIMNLVSNLQQKLIDLGFLEGTPTGVYDNETTNAVRNFQSEVGIAPSGVVDAATALALENYIPPDSGVATTNIQSPTLKIGSSGAAVRILQEMLINYGYLNDVADGIFGPKTEEAVRAFQQANGLKVDGIAGPATWAALFAYDAPQTPPVARPELNEGSSGDEVTKLQNKLYDYNFLIGRPDGYFGPRTADAVKNFQSAVGLEPTGVVDDETYEALDNYNPKPEPTLPTLREGANNEFVKLLQSKLKELGFYKGEINSDFDKETLEAIKNFQTQADINPDGVVGDQTWSRLNSNQASGGFPILMEGDTGPNVAILQERIFALGYYKGYITGRFDNETKDAVTKFQKDTGLSSDGIVGPLTWEAIESQFQLPVQRRVLGLGSFGEDVEIIQEILFALGYYNGDITGNFDTNTMEAVKAFQEDNGLVPDGIVGPETWNAIMNSIYNKPQNTKNRPTLRFGDKNNYVKALQEILKNLKYYTGPITSDFDDRTTEAVKAFQFDNNIPTDGIVGKDTWAALDNALGRNGIPEK